MIRHHSDDSFVFFTAVCKEITDAVLQMIRLERVVERVGERVGGGGLV